MMIWKVTCKVDGNCNPRVFFAHSAMGAGMIADLVGGVIGTERMDEVSDADAHDWLNDSYWALVARFRGASDWPDIKEICERATGYGRPLWSL